MAITRNVQGTFIRACGDKLPAKHETLEEVRERLINEIMEPLKIKVAESPEEWVASMPKEIFDPANDKSARYKGQPGPDWRNSEYYRGNSGDMADVVWNLRSQLTELQRENQILKTQLNDIKSILSV